MAMMCGFSGTLDNLPTVIWTAIVNQDNFVIPAGSRKEQCDPYCIAYEFFTVIHWNDSTVTEGWLVYSLFFIL